MKRFCEDHYGSKQTQNDLGDIFLTLLERSQRNKMKINKEISISSQHAPSEKSSGSLRSRRRSGWTTQRSEDAAALLGPAVEVVTSCYSRVRQVNLNPLLIAFTNILFVMSWVCGVDNALPPAWQGTSLILSRLSYFQLL